MCCNTPDTCINGACCPQAQTCGGNCCQANDTCVNSACCPLARQCGGACCGPDQACAGGQCKDKPSTDCNGKTCKCNPLAVGDPVHVGAGASFLTAVDIAMHSLEGTLELQRTYSSDESSWAIGEIIEPVPKPFGSSPTNAGSLNWWHNFYALVYPVSSVWLVRDTAGQLLRFNPCTGTPCWAERAESNADRHERLERNANGFRLVRASGEQLFFESKWATTPNAVSRYFLSRIATRAGIDTAVVGYATPAGLTCPGGAAGTDPGVPYISQVTASDGTRLLFSYGKPGSECIIAAVERRGVNQSNDVVSTTEYAYATTGLPSSANTSWIEGQVAGYRFENYSYSSTELLQSRSDDTIVRHVISNGTPTGAESLGEQLTIGYQQSSTSCLGSSLCCGDALVVQTVVSTAARSGDETNAVAGLSTTYEVLPNIGGRPGQRPYRIMDTCQSPGACSPGSTQYEWTCGTPSMPGVEKARKDKRDNWVTSSWSYVAGGQGEFALEKRAEKRGATDMEGTGSLEEDSFSYLYGANGQQLLDRIERPSVLAAGQVSGTKHLYDPTSNRGLGTIRYGQTRTESGSLEMRYVGTFQYVCEEPSNGTCSGGTDPFGRTRAIHGPCRVQGLSSTYCDVDVMYPVTRFGYYGSGTGNQANRLHTKTRYPNGTGAPGLTESYDSYNARGNPTAITDSNGVTTALTYDEDRVATRTVAGHTTKYTYEHDRLQRIEYPEGNLEVFSYVSNWNSTPQLQWKAKVSGTWGNEWSEKVEYAYWPDGTVRSESFWSQPPYGSPELRRVKSYAADAHRRPTLEKVGDGAGAFATVRGFDRANNVAGVGLPFNQPPAWCGGVTGGVPYDTAASRLCAWLGYDRANRLESLVEHPEPSNASKDATTCFAHDGHGNVTRVIAGCQTSDSCATVLADPQHACQALAATYEFDDFGNLTRASLPSMGEASGSPGTILYLYDPMGNMVKKRSPQMQADGDAVEYSYDFLGRMTAANHRLANNSLEILYRFAYDTSEAPAPYCAVPTNTNGRLLRRVDSFGSTWYHYDAEGRVVREMRLRAAYGSCSNSGDGHADTHYGYTPNGNLGHIIYPYGRKVTYEYGSGAYQDRVQRVLLARSEGYGSWWDTSLLFNVTWEPYSDQLRSYGATNWGGSNPNHVEYLTGEASQVPGSACSAGLPSADDKTGRLRALWVSSAPWNSTGDVYKRTYTWSGDQVSQTDTCLLGSSSGRTETFSYDALTRVTAAARPSGNFAMTGGTFDSRSYGYDQRGNRTTSSEDGCSLTMNYAPVRLDHLGSLASSCNARRFDFQRDRDGRVTSISGAQPTSGYAHFKWNRTFDYGGAQGGSEAVFKAVGGFLYANYFYDAFGRRTAKQETFGNINEFFYDLGHQLLSDVASPPFTYSSMTVIDDYVWLGGRPVAVIRGKLSSNGNGPSYEADGQGGDCRAHWWEGDRTCGLYKLVTDHIGKPVLALDSLGRIAGAADYDPFGRPNTVPFSGPQPATYGDNLTDQLIWEVRQPPEPGMTVKMRLLFHLQEVGGTNDFAQVKDIDSSSVLIANTLDNLSLPSMTSWFSTPSGHVGLFMNSDSYNNYAYKGVVPEAYQYERVQMGATPFWTPLRFPGQYFDWDTGFTENWNRYYDETSGAYLQPEPLLQDPISVAATAHDGRSMPSYSYAFNNPVYFVDPNGLEGVPPSLNSITAKCVTNPELCAAVGGAVVGTAAGAATGSGTGSGTGTGAEPGAAAGGAANDNTECEEPDGPTNCILKGGVIVQKLRWALGKPPCLYKCDDGTWEERPFNLGANSCKPWINK